jgi:Fic family protein
MAYTPRFDYYDAMVHRLMEIARHREFSDHVPISPSADFRLRKQARQRSTHSSTVIEGNPITQKSIPETIADRGRTPSEAQMEVRNYWRALEWIDEAVADEVEPSETVIQRLHAIIYAGGRGRPRETSQYRTGQMRITDSATGKIEYMAPEPQDVPSLMFEFVAWWKSQAAQNLPAAIRAGIVAYRFVTIHPFDDGNGRTTRALATYELWRSGYAFRGYLALEDYYARDLQAYYGALQMGLNHNYYFGRHDPDLTPWLDFFTETLLQGAREVRKATEQVLGMEKEARPRKPITRRLDNLVLRALVQAIVERRSAITFAVGDLIDWFGVSDKTARDWLAGWRQQGHVEPATGDERVRSWRFAGELGKTVETVRKDAIAEGEGSE